MRITGLLILVLALNASAHATTWHVATHGNDEADGSEKTPFASLKRAIEAATTATGASEIVMHAGVFRAGASGEWETTIPATAQSNPPPLVIRAALTADGKFEEVIIDGGQKITEATVVDAARGIYFQPFHLANFEPSIWEVKSRVRYDFVADLRAVEAFPASLAPGQFKVNEEMKEGVFFRTSNGMPPGSLDLGMARDLRGLFIQRPNVTVKGLRFRNFQLYFGVCGILINAANVTVDSCEAWNCWGGFMVGEGISDAKILNCTARDVATGVKSYGKNTVVENCRFFRVEDSFAVPEYEQDQCGIQFYTSHTQTARRNLCVGFQAGIFIKASGGVAILDDNTLIASTRNNERGIGPNTWRAGSSCRSNVVVGFSEPISMGAGSLSNQCTVSDNVVWFDGKRKLMEQAVAAIKTANGGENWVARPRFADIARDDYRVTATDLPEETGEQKPAIVSAEPARLVGKPVVRANEHGAVILFKTDQPCTAAVEWGADKSRLDQRVDDAQAHRTESPADENGAKKSWPRTDHCLAILSGLEAGRTYPFRVLLNDSTESVHQGEFTLKGSPRTLHVATSGVDREDGGAKDRPFATLQFAVDRALPGDRVLVAPGLYTGSVWMTHGGVKDQPITIESSEPWGAVLDGRRQEEFAIRMGSVANLPEDWSLGCRSPAKVAHVRISGFEMRWFNGMTVQANESQDIVIEGCKFWSRHYVKGRPGISEGIGAYHSERITIDRNLFFMLNTAVRFNNSVGLRLTRNTAARCFHRVIGIVGARDLYLRNNSFAFGGSYLLQIHGVDLKEIDSDYNNFAVYLRSDSAHWSSAPPDERLTREKGFYYGESKSLAAWDERTPEKPDPYILTLTLWRAATGQDKHSISAHPRYVDPQSRDFRLMTNSPNIGAGENGTNIGAL